jgi:molybdenum cofactor cytidylyltransferase
MQLSAPQTERAVTGLVLAAGGSSRLGRAKQLLEYRGTTLLGHVLSVARECSFHQLLCVVGGSIDEVRASVDLSGVDVVENRAFGTGCSSSIAAALQAVDARASVLVLILGDQPGVTPVTVEKLLGGIGDAPIAACAYADGRGHPLAFAREVFEELGQLHGDKAVWKLLDRHAEQVADVPIGGATPRDVDTWEDYEAVRSSAELMST